MKFFLLIISSINCLLIKPRLSRLGNVQCCSSNLILTLNNNNYNLTSWEFQNPKEYRFLKKYNNKDITQDYENLQKSYLTKKLLEIFLIDKDLDSLLISNTTNNNIENNQFSNEVNNSKHYFSKLITPEDKFNIHKTIGIYCLVHFIYRYYLFGTNNINGGITTNYISILSIFIHGLLSLSSLSFIIPRKRIETSSIIWNEFRINNIIYSWRSIICCFYMWIGMRYNLKQLSIILCSLQVYNSMYASDLVAKMLKSKNNNFENKTILFWNNCNNKVKKKLTCLYEYSKSLATLLCLSSSNIIWPFFILLPAQLSAFLMTLTRKDLINIKQGHYIYIGSLCMLFVASIYYSFKMSSYYMLFLYIVAGLLYKLETMGVNKYKIWLPIISTRILTSNI